MQREIRLAEYDSSWPEQYRRHADSITEALGEALLSIEHVGSMSVPSLAAKPIIDIVLVVRDSSDEDSYLPQLTRAGYELRVREPKGHEQRMFRTRELDVHIHVFSESCSEVDRMLGCAAASVEWIYLNGGRRPGRFPKQGVEPGRQ